MPRMRDRSVGDLLVLMIAGTICSTVVLGSVSLIAFRIFNPEAGVSPALAALTDIINTLIGLLAGFLAGRTEMNVKKSETDVTTDNE
jgi:hypothetical protein